MNLFKENFFAGYQSSGPRSVVGKLLSIGIACIGLPIFFLYICLVGGFLARHLQRVYVRLSCCRRPAEYAGTEEQTRQTANVAREYWKPVLQKPYSNNTLEQKHGRTKVRPRVPLWICAVIVTAYLLLGSLWVSQYHQVHFIDGFHYCTIWVTHLDLQAGGGSGKGSGNDSSEDLLSTVITSLYILIGVALVAMCAQFLKQDIAGLLESLTKTHSPSSPGSWHLPSSRDSSLDDTLLLQDNCLNTNILKTSLNSFDESKLDQLKPEHMKSLVDLPPPPPTQFSWNWNKTNTTFQSYAGSKTQHKNWNTWKTSFQVKSTENVYKRAL